MTIKGLSEQRRIPRLGKIHLGFKDPTKKGAPTATDYFVCPPEIQSILGEKPKELKIMIPSEDEEKFASQYYKCYSRSRGLICKGDGETAIRMIDVKTGDLAGKDTSGVEMKEVPCQGRECPDYGRKQCREIMCFQFLIPEVPGLGVWQIDTSSINSIRNVNSMVDLIRIVSPEHRISMIPLLLSLEPIEIQDSESKKKTVNVLNLRVKETLYELAETMNKIKKGEYFALPPADEERPELLYEDLPVDEEQAKKDIKDLFSEGGTEPEEPPAYEPKELNNLGQFFGASNKRWGFTRSETEIQLGKSGTQIVDLKAEWENLKRKVETGE